MNEVFEKIKEDNDEFINNFIKLVSSTKRKNVISIASDLKLCENIKENIELKNPILKDFKHIFLLNNKDGLASLCFLDSKKNWWFFEEGKSNKINFSHITKVLNETGVEVKYTKDNIIIEETKFKKFKLIVPENKITKEMVDFLFLTQDVDISELLKVENQQIKFPNPEVLNFINDNEEKKDLKNYVNKILRNKNVIIGK